MQTSLSNAALTVQGYSQLFIHGPAFENFANASIAVTSSTCGVSGSVMAPPYTGSNAQFPDIQWAPSQLDRLMESYLVIVEDPDAPLPEPVVHGIYYDITDREQSVSSGDFRSENNEVYNNLLVGGFRYGKNYADSVYLGPSPPPGDGQHKYFYQVVGLSKTLDLDSLSSKPSKRELASAVVGRVGGWGAWTGVYGVA